jgi:hypothetical protein
MEVLAITAVDGRVVNVIIIGGGGGGGSVAVSIYLAESQEGVSASRAAHERGERVKERKEQGEA